MRIDQALVKQHFFQTRTKAKEALLAGGIFYAGQEIKKPSFEVADPALLRVESTGLPYVSRGGLKLEKALSVFSVDLHGKVVLDIGSSTGGFTDCALQHGAASVIAVDVGRDQMDKSLRDLATITLYEQTDFRQIDLERVSRAQFAVIDVSFISVKKLLDQLVKLPHLIGVICLIKPQFECGKKIADQYHGVISTPSVHPPILQDILQAFSKHGLFCHGLTFSPITGGSGNREYLAYFTKASSTCQFDFQKIVASAFAEI